ncbi:protein-L-isoaspartate(D-aspartate) O-methyltransferase [Aureliella helgolandensis]|uniref:Protein-L-isoaspartate O-methyltransferase n=1 Tax=Aureliella helgolandensis TaxID=2527968 RepID=A0A518GH41_9BACT|nr:protein-L-isoaspartate(D-aspartate) O-methyltransferase [Aureliella helgolandensis]QDV27915.1 Protein-L-isoaspartate O-methyltransferase [Aureliella helgolandensis]
MISRLARGLQTRCLLWGGLVCLVLQSSNAVHGQVGLPPFSNFETARERLIQDVLIPGGVNDTRVIDAIRATPRQEFIPFSLRADAYADSALPIGASQTISSPYIVSIMTQELDVQADHKVLEIGTGSGFQAAVLSPLVKEVYSIEIVPELGTQAKKVLDALGYRNVFTKIGDGFLGWEEHAPFDRIIVTCSPEDVPQPLVDQLVDGGLIVVPVGERYQQTLYLMRKVDGKLEREALRPTLFVPMTGTAEENRQVHVDPARPALLNGDFEQPPADNGYVPGWYYQRGLKWSSSEESPNGGHYVEFTNETAGRPAHLLQGIALDGRVVKRVRLSGSVKVDGVKVGLDRNELPVIGIRFFNDQRGLLGTHWIGPFRGTRDWKEESRVFRVPAAAREAIVSIGLLGGVGKVAFDGIQLEAVEP